MARSPLFGRRIHIAGSIANDPHIAPAAEVQRAREFVQHLVRGLVQRGATFVLPVDAEPTRSADELPICFDWLMWNTIHTNLHRRPSDALDPLVVAVQHHKNEEQIPEPYVDVWEALRTSDRVYIENVSHWNMNSKRMEAQARAGDILIALGGDEGVMNLANLYHDAGKPVVPLDFAITAPNTGARRLFDVGLTRSTAHRLFQVDEHNPHAWVNRIRMTNRTSTPDGVANVLALLEALTPPRAFVVRLLNPGHEDYDDVQAFFDTVVKPVVEGELGYRMTVVDSRHVHEQPRIDQEIFDKLHRSSVVIADLTGERPNCFLELGYALGRGLPTIVTAKEGSKRPFDVTTYAMLSWTPSGAVDERRRAFRDYWEAVRIRPPLVPLEPLIP